MKIKFLNLKFAFLLTAGLFISNLASSATFTATASGLWSNSATWVGGLVPTTIIITDQIIIPSGVTVTMDNSTSISGLLTFIDVQGTLMANTNTSLTVGAASITGSGVITLDNLVLNNGSIIMFTGSLAANTLTTAATGLNVSASILVGETLTLASGTLNIIAGGNLDVVNNATIIVAGGMLTSGGGTLGLLGSYNVTYTTTSAIAGIELSGSGLNNLTVDVSNGNTVTLASNLTLSDTLHLTSGRLVLGGFNLALTGEIASGGGGYISSTSASNISIATNNGTTGALTFSGNANAVNNLTINVGAGSQTRIAGSLAVAGTLNLNSGTLDFSSASLEINGNVSGQGTLKGNTSSNLTVLNITGVSGAIKFATGGQMVNDFNINVGAGNALMLGSNLTVFGSLNHMANSNLDISGQTLTIGNAGTISGNGSLVTNVSSRLIINSGNGITNPIHFASASIGNFKINVGAGNSVALGDNIIVADTLSITSGLLVLNNKDLTISGSIDTAAVGQIFSSATSNLTVNSSVSMLGALVFSTGSLVNDFTINVPANNMVWLGTNLIINGELTFTSGKLNVGNNLLLMGNTSGVTGASSTMYVVTGTLGSMAMSLTAGATASKMYPVGTTTQYAPASISLNATSTSGVVNVNVADNVKSMGTTGTDVSAVQPMVDATWNITSTITSNLNMNLQLMWMTSNEVNSFDRNAAHISHYTNGDWDFSAATTATFQSTNMYAVQRAGITSLSPFAVFDNHTNTAVREVSNNIQFKTYPNPANDFITVSTNLKLNNVLYADIISTLGTTIKTIKLSNTNTTISLEDLASGNYFIRYYNNTINEVHKFVKL